MSSGSYEAGSWSSKVINKLNLDLSICHLIYFFRLTVIIIPVITFIIYLPSILRYEVVKCISGSNESITYYYKRNNDKFLDSMFYSVSLLSDKMFTTFYFISLSATFLWPFLLIELLTSIMNYCTNMECRIELN